MKKIDITSIVHENGGQLHYESEEPVQFDDLNFKSPLKISLDLTNTGNGILVEGSISGALETACVGCLTPLQETVTTEISEEFVPLSQALPEVEDDMALEELAVFTLEGDERLDPTEAVRQAILLSLPTEPRCKPDCKGLCPKCGANRNAGECDCKVESKTTPEERWNPLLKLRRMNPNG